MTKKGLIGKIAVGAVAGLSLLPPVIANGQKVAKPVENINWTKQQKTPYQDYTLLINSKNALPELSRYKSGVPKEYLSKGGNLNLYPNHYEIPQDQIQGYIADYLRKIGVCQECTKQKKPTPVKKKSSVKHVLTPKKPVQPQKPAQKPAVPPTSPSKLEKKVEEPYVPRGKEEQGINYNVIETNTTNNITNNYYLKPEEVKIAADTASKKAKEDYLRFRAIIDAGKVVNPLNSPFWNFSINPQLYKGSFGFGPSLTIGAGKERDVITTEVENETLLNQDIQLFTGTKGIRKENIERCFPIEWGAILSAGTKDNRFRIDMGYGMLKEVNSTSGISESGVDYIRQGNEFIDKKLYGPIQREQGKKYETWKQTQYIGLALSPFNNGRVGLKGKVKHVGKPGSEDGFFLYEVGLTGTLGGGKRVR